MRFSINSHKPSLPLDSYEKRVMEAQSLNLLYLSWDTSRCLTEDCSKLWKLAWANDSKIGSAGDYECSLHGSSWGDQNREDEYGPHLTCVHQDIGRCG